MFVSLATTLSHLLTLDKPPSTYFALVWPLSGVDADVRLEVVLPFELAGTILTLVDASLVATVSVEPI